MSDPSTLRATRPAITAAVAALLILAAPASAATKSRTARHSTASAAAGQPSGGGSSGGTGLGSGSQPASTSTSAPTTTTTATPTPSPPPHHFVPLREGMRGWRVRLLQQNLTIAGYPTPADGDFGPMTKASVVAFQAAHYMRQSGVVWWFVAQALHRVVAAYKAATAPVGKAKINADGTATAPAGAPPAVLALIAAANQIIDTSYCYAGGHQTWKDSCYDCSGSVSYALHGANLLSAPEDSTELESFGDPGPGQWITVYADSGHTFLVVAGIAFDTADYGGPNIPAGTGPRWRSNPTGNLADGGNYVVRHPAGL